MVTKKENTLYSLFGVESTSEFMSYIMQRYSCPWFFAITAKSSQKKNVA
nr:MAG TPA: hypothetical protein [Caudoviricetes sp.]